MRRCKSLKRSGKIHCRDPRRPHCADGETEVREGGGREARTSGTWSGGQAAGQGGRRRGGARPSDSSARECGWEGLSAPHPCAPPVRGAAAPQGSGGPAGGRGAGQGGKPWDPGAPDPRLWPPVRDSPAGRGCRKIWTRTPGAPPPPRPGLRGRADPGRGDLGRAHSRALSSALGIAARGGGWRRPVPRSPAPTGGDTARGRTGAAPLPRALRARRFRSLGRPEPAAGKSRFHPPRGRHGSHPQRRSELRAPPFRGKLRPEGNLP